MGKKIKKVATVKNLKAGAVCKNDNEQTSVWGMGGLVRIAVRNDLERAFERLQVVFNFTSTARPRYTPADTIADGLIAIGVVTVGLSVKETQDAMLCDLLAIEKLHEAAYQFEVDGWKEEDQKASHALRVKMNLAAPRLPAKAPQVEVAKAEVERARRMHTACAEILAEIGANPFGAIGQAKRDQGGKATRTFVTEGDLPNAVFRGMDSDTLALLEADAPAKLVLASGAVIELTLKAPAPKKAKNASKSTRANANEAAVAMTLEEIRSALA